MKIITKNNDIIVAISKDVREDSNMIELDEGIIIPKNLVKEIYSVESVPEDVAPIRYCYNNEENFYLNPRYKENYSLEEKVSALEDAVNLLLGF